MVTKRTTKFGGGVYPEHEGDGEEGEDDEADCPDEDARHDARHHAGRRVDLGMYQHLDGKDLLRCTRESVFSLRSNMPYKHQNQLSK